MTDYGFCSSDRRDGIGRMTASDEMWKERPAPDSSQPRRAGSSRQGSSFGDLVAIPGIGGLGHLGVQLAAKMGFRTVAIAPGSEKAKLANQLGAHHYIDASTQDVAAALRHLGGARVVAETATNRDAISTTIAGLAPTASFSRWRSSMRLCTSRHCS